MPSTVNITVEDDADFYQLFQYTLPDGVTPISAVGSTFNFGVRRTAADTGILFRVTSTLSSAGQIAIVDGPNGKFSLWIARAQLLAAPNGTFVHSLLINMPAVGAGNGAIPALTVPIWNGTIIINPGASR